jgi:hypothetical protein
MAAFEESAAEPTIAAPEFYTWTFPGAPVRIHLHLNVVESLGREVRRAFESVPSHSVEIGGILYGTADFAASPIIEIKDFEPFLCEYRPDHRFILSDADQRKLEKVLAARRADGSDALSVVGYYRSQINEGLNLREEDVAIAQSNFYDPANVFLLVKPSSDGTSSAGFFFWDKGRIDSEFTYLEFPFEARQLSALRAKPIAPVIAERLAEPEMPVRTAAFAVPASIPPKFDTAEPLPRPGPRSTSLLWRALFVVLMIALGALGYQAYLAWMPSQSAATAPVESDAPALALQVERRGADLRVSWNRSSRTVTQATSAVLSIKDGETQQQELRLDLEQLRNGSVFYTPANSAVRFRLEVTTPGDVKTSETVLALTAARPDAKAALAEAQPPATGPSPQPDAAATNSPATGAGRNFGEPMRVVMVNPPAKPAGGTPVPEATQPRTGPADSPETEPLYLAAKPTRQVQPALPAAVRKLIAAPVDVNVKVTISAAGRVERAEPLPNPEPVSSTLVAAAHNAALRWRFAPAIRGTKAVPSELILRFQFRPTR